MNDDDRIRGVLRDFVAMERDRQLGYAPDELHTNPRRALVRGLRALEDLGDDPEDVVWPEDQDRLGIEVTSNE